MKHWIAAAGMALALPLSWNAHAAGVAAMPAANGSSGGVLFKPMPKPKAARRRSRCAALAYRPACRTVWVPCGGACHSTRSMNLCASRCSHLAL